jgi:hypothetical protein
MIEDEVEVIEFNGASGVSGTSEGIMSRIKNFLLKGYRVNLIVSKGAVKQVEVS